MADEEIFDLPTVSSKNTQAKHIGSKQRIMAYSLYLELKRDSSKSAAIKLTAKQLGVGERTVWDIVKEKDTTGVISSPPKICLRQSAYDSLDEADRSAIRRHIHSFFLQNELPTCTKLLGVINADDTLPVLKRTTLWKILKKLGFKWMKRSGNSVLIERQDIVLWRRQYLNNIRKFRVSGRKIYYLDETWVNASHTKQKIWADTTVLTARQAFVEGVSTGPKNPSGKGKRLIVLHIGSEDGFLENGLLFFESKETGDYHEEMNSQVFTEWMRNVLPFLEPNSVIIMDNAPYHSGRTEKKPIMAWKKQQLNEWLLAKGIIVDNTLLKVVLLELARKYINDNPIPYVIDQMVEDSGHTILRLPPYHCNLNPIELIWAQVKHHVAANNKTFKLPEVKTLLIEGLNIVDSSAWRNCIKHVIEEENKMYQLDSVVEDMIEEFIITANTSSSSDLSLESDSE